MQSVNSSVTASCSEPATELDDETLFERAREAVAAGDAGSAMRAYEELDLRGSENIETHFELAQLYLAAGDHAAASQSVIKSLALKPDHWASLALAMQIFQLSKDLAPDDAEGFGRIPDRLIDLYLAEEKDKRVSSERHPSVEAMLAFPEEATRVFPPKNIQRTSFYPEVRDALSPDRYVYRLSHCSVWYDDFNIAFFDADGHTLRLPMAIGCQPLLSKATANRPPLTLQGNTLLLGSRGSNGYGHWILDVIATVGAVKSAAIRIDDIDHILLAGADLGFKKAVLNSLGLGHIPIASSDQHPFVAATSLITADVVTNMCVRAGTWLPTFLRSQFLRHEAPLETALQTRRHARIYVGRGGVGRRNVDNEDAMKAALAPFGFTFIEIEKYSQYEQAELFSAADVIVAPHGAALTNLAYCRPGTKIIEAYGPHIEPCFWILSNICQLDYYNIKGVFDPLSEAGDGADAQTFSVDVEDLLDTLSYAGVSKQ
jgi:hypothetical protein